MNVSKVSGVNFSRRSSYTSPYTKTQPYTNGNDYGTLTQYFDKEGKLIGFRRVHNSGFIERAYQYPDGTILITKKFNNHQPAIVKGFDSHGNFHPEMPIRNILGHNPNRRIVEEKWAEEALLNKEG